MAGLKGKSGPPDNMNAFKHGSRPDNFASLIPSKTKIYGNAASTIVSAYGEQVVKQSIQNCVLPVLLPESATTICSRRERELPVCCILNHLFRHILAHTGSRENSESIGRADFPFTFHHRDNHGIQRNDTRIFSPHTVPRLCVTIGRYWYLFKRLMAVSARRFYRFEHIVTYSSGKVVAKSVNPPDPKPSQTGH